MTSTKIAERLVELENMLDHSENVNSKLRDDKAGLVQRADFLQKQNEELKRQLDGFQKARGDEYFQLLQTLHIQPVHVSAGEYYKLLKRLIEGPESA